MLDFDNTFGTITVSCDNKGCNSEEEFDGFDGHCDLDNAKEEMKRLGWKNKLTKCCNAPANNINIVNNQRRVGESHAGKKWRFNPFPPLRKGGSSNGRTLVLPEVETY